VTRVQNPITYTAARNAESVHPSLQDGEMIGVMKERIFIDYLSFLILSSAFLEDSLKRFNGK
jgi:hypothetical protein